MPSVQRFLIHNGDRPGRAIDLVTFPFTIGRARECDLVLDAGDVSRLHAQLSSDHLNLYLEDLGSTKDRKSTRLNSSHVKISYAVFCLKKKKDKKRQHKI